MINRPGPSHLPRVIRLQLDGSQRSQTCYEGDELALDQGDAVEQDAVGQDQSHEGPAHGDQDGQSAVHTKDQGSVL